MDESSAKGIYLEKKQICDAMDYFLLPVDEDRIDMETSTLASMRVCSLSGIRTTPVSFFDSMRYFWGTPAPGIPLQ
jgi:hypothetical protein